MNRGSVSGVYTRHLYVFRYRLSFAGPKRFRGFRETGPWTVNIDSISAALSCLVYPPREESSGRSAGSFPDQRLVIEPTVNTAFDWLIKNLSTGKVLLEK